MMHDLHNFSDIADKNGYAGSDSKPDKKRQRINSHRAKSNIIESISWQWLYATHLPVAYELILTTKDAPMSITLYSWLPVEVVIVVAWILKSYLSSDSPLFNPIEEQEATSVLTEGRHSFAAITMMIGAGHNQQPNLSSESSSQPAPETTTHRSGFSMSYLNTDYGDGNRGPQKHLHTLGLNCFVYPCRGVCILRTSPVSTEAIELSLNSGESSTSQTEAESGQSSCPHSAVGRCLRCIGHFDPENAADSQKELLFESWTDLPPLQELWDSDQLLLNLSEAIGIAVMLNHTETQQTDNESSQLSQSQPHLSQSGAMQATDNIEQCVWETGEDWEDGQWRLCRGGGKSTQGLSDDKQRDHSRPKTCDVIIVGKDGQQRPCGMVYKHAQSLSSHKNRYHTEQKNCDVTVIGKDGLPRPCGRTYKNLQSLSSHKNRYHSGQKNCDVTVIGKDGQPRPCGVLCRNSNALWGHKTRAHTRQQTCVVTMIGEDGQQRPCGAVCRNFVALWNHKRNVHSGKKNCDVAVVGEDGQQRPCGKVCKNVNSLLHHKLKDHTGEKKCQVTVVGEGGRQRPCGKVCSNAAVLSAHRAQCHNGQKTCDVTVVGEDGQQRPCGKVCKNIHVLWNHKSRKHTGQQVCDATVIGEDGQKRPCGMIYKNAKSLWDHKKIHRKRKPADLDQIDDISP